MRILVLSRNGLLYSTSRIVLTARAAGHEVDVIDPLELQIQVGQGLPRLSRAGRPLGRYQAVIPRIGTSITRYGAAVLSQLEPQAAVLNGSAAILLARDKVATLRRLQQHRIAVPRTVCTRSLAGIDAALAAVGGCPAIVKLQQGTQGIGTMIAESPRALFALIETLWAMGQEIVLQELITESHGRDVRILVVGDRVVAAMRRTAQAGEFRSNLHRGAIGEAVTLPRSYRSCALRATRAVGLCVCGVDVLETARGPLVIELNSSPGLEGIEQATGIDIAAKIIKHAEQCVERAKPGARTRQQQQ